MTKAEVAKPRPFRLAEPTDEYDFAYSEGKLNGRESEGQDSGHCCCAKKDQSAALIISSLSDGDGTRFSVSLHERLPTQQLNVRNDIGRATAATHQMMCLHSIDRMHCGNLKKD